MSKILDLIWAKKKEENNLYYWLPLKQHAIDTMDVMDYLWEHWISDGQKELLLQMYEVYSEDSLKQLVKFIGAVHDIGKITPVFQTKKSYHASSGLDQSIIEQLVQNGLKKFDTFDFRNPNESPHALAGEVLLNEYLNNEGVASIVGGHHGKPVDSKEDVKRQLSSFTANYYLEGDGNIRIWKEIQKAFFEWALTISGVCCVEDIYKMKQPGLVVLEGMLIMADWIASNEYYFPLYEFDDEKTIEFGSRKSVGLSKWVETYKWNPQYHANANEYYKLRFNFIPHDFQKKLFNIVESSIDLGIVIVEAPMGLGKTEGALISAEQLARKGKCGGLYFGLPTQATSNGIFPRIKDWLNQVANDDSEKKSIQLVHGKAYLNQKYNDTKYKRNDSIKDDAQVFVNDWFVGRKTSNLDDFVVGTIDQLLLMALKSKHLALRHLGFSKKVVIIDEVHAYDMYMSQYLYQAIRWLGAYKIPVIVLSATLPRSKREELVKSYMYGKFDRKSFTSLPKSVDGYPLITYTEENNMKQFLEFEKIEDKIVKVISISDEELEEVIEDCLQEGGVMGIVVNTVKRSQELMKLISQRFEQEVVELFHSSFIAVDRIAKEDKLVAKLGKNRERPKLKIIIGTQVIEQSLDIDFDVMISDLAPMDLLMQRIGRLHRHTHIKRPQKLNEPKLYVLGINNNYEFERGSSAVYDDYYLIRTQYFLPDVIHMPSDISSLVQKVYDDEIPIETDLLHEYNKAKENTKNKKTIKKEKAKAYRLGKPEQTKESLIGWLKNINLGTSETNAYAQVRDSIDTIEVIVIKKIGTSYGFVDGNEEIKEKLGDQKISKKLATYTLNLPNALCYEYKIDSTIKALENLYKQHFNEWSENVWLKGGLGLLLDENNKTELNGFNLYYSKEYGLQYEKKED